MLQRLRDYFFQPKLRTADALRDFVSSQASYLAQRTSLEFSRNTFAYSHQYMMYQDSFLDEMRKCRWESFAALVEDMLVAVEGKVRPPEAKDAENVAAALAGMARAILERYERPAHRPGGWDDVLTRIAARLAQARLAPPKAPNEIAAVAAGRLYVLMPVHSDNPKKDRDLVDGAVRFGFAGFAAKLFDALEPEPVRADLLARAAG